MMIRWTDRIDKQVERKYKGVLSCGNWIILHSSVSHRSYVGSQVNRKCFGFANDEFSALEIIHQRT